MRRRLRRPTGRHNWRSNVHELASRIQDRLQWTRQSGKTARSYPLKLHGSGPLRIVVRQGFNYH